jgi:hypothetical protein
MTAGHLLGQECQPQSDERSTALSTETPFEVPPSGPLAADLAEQQVEQTRAEGLDVVGPGGLRRI